MKKIMMLSVAALALTGCRFESKSEVTKSGESNKPIAEALEAGSKTVECEVLGGGKVVIQSRKQGDESKVSVKFLDNNGAVKKIAIQGEADGREIELSFSEEQCRSTVIDESTGEKKIVCGPVEVEGITVAPRGDNAEEQATVKKIAIQVEGSGKIQDPSEDRYQTAGQFVVTSKYLVEGGDYENKDSMMGREVNPEILKSCVEVSGDQDTSTN